MVPTSPTISVFQSVSSLIIHGYDYVCRSSICADVSGRMGVVVQRKHRRPDVQEGARTHQQRRRPARSQPQPQVPHVQALSHGQEVCVHFSLKVCLSLSVLM